MHPAGCQRESLNYPIMKVISYILLQSWQRGSTDGMIFHIADGSEPEQWPELPKCTDEGQLVR